MRRQPDGLAVRERDIDGGARRRRRARRTPRAARRARAASPARRDAGRRRAPTSACPSASSVSRTLPSTMRTVDVQRRRRRRRSPPPSRFSRSLSRIDETLSSPDSPRTTSMRGRSSSTSRRRTPPDSSDASATLARTPGITTGGAAPAPSTTRPRSSSVPKPTLTSFTVTLRPSRAETLGNTRVRTSCSPTQRHAGEDRRGDERHPNQRPTQHRPLV